MRNLNDVTDGLESGVQPQVGVDGHGVEVFRTLQVFSEASKKVERINQIQSWAHPVNLPGDVRELKSGEPWSKSNLIKKLKMKQRFFIKLLCEITILAYKQIKI